MKDRQKKMIPYKKLQGFLFSDGGLMNGRTSKELRKLCNNNKQYIRLKDAWTNFPHNKKYSELKKLREFIKQREVNNGQ